MKTIGLGAIVVILFTFCGACNSTQSPESKTATSIPIDAKKQSRDNFKKGAIKGHICYPSDFVIPAMKLYAKDIEHNKIYSLATKDNDTSFIFKDLPEGKYVVYAYTIDSEMQDAEGHKLKGSGGYTYAVPCGLSVGCKDQRLIPVEVKAGASASHVDVCDWYGAIVPAE